MDKINSVIKWVLIYRQKVNIEYIVLGQCDFSLKEMTSEFSYYTLS